MVSGGQVLWLEEQLFFGSVGERGRWIPSLFNIGVETGGGKNDNLVRGRVKRDG
jgi:hypothetical protein